MFISLNKLFRGFRFDTSVILCDIFLPLVFLLFLTLISFRKYLILGPNSIIITKKILCCKRETVYNIGELKKAVIMYESEYDEGATSYYYKFYLLFKSNKKEVFLQIEANKNKDEDLKYLKGFIDIINAHIEKKRNQYESNYY